ncbi:MAG TPA: DNA methyltransferase [Fimbriimonadaceae bacterium]|jgi:site-specific DNA-methyltransferase (adenine-specific)
MTLHLGDCLQILPTYADACFDFVLTDPPYLVNYRDRRGRSLMNDDNDAWLVPAFAELYCVLKPNSYCVSFYGYPAADRFIGAWRSAGFRIAGHIVFSKDYASNAFHMEYRHECAYLLTKGSPRPRQILPDVLPWHYSGNRHHPTEKSVATLKPLVEAFSDPGDFVLDPFAGSGSTLIAARECGRYPTGIELSPGHHAKAQQRLSHHPAFTKSSLDKSRIGTLASTLKERI